MKQGILLCLMVVLTCGMLVFGGCESSAQTGALVGSGVGALAGQAIGRDTKSTLIGAAVGGGAGYVIGAEKDKAKKTQAEMDNLRQEMNVVSVNITNSNGSVSQVRLKKQGIGYVGPRGEYYNSLPTEEELKPIYGF